jgi:hypothetical protein
VIVRRGVIAASLLAIALSLPGCGSDDTKAAATSSPAPAAATSSANSSGAIAAPTPEQLTTLLNALIDPDKPAAEKAKLMTNGESRVAKIDEFNKKMNGYKVTFNPTKIALQGTSATSEVQVTSAMAPAAMPVPMTFDNAAGVWKLSEASTCTIFGFSGIQC